MKKILLGIPDNSPFYVHLFHSIKRGFEEAGFHVIGDGGILEPQKLLEDIETFSPDIVFEMNRVKSEIPNFPEGILHLCWLVDFWGRHPHQISGSDILYTFSKKWISHFPQDCAKKIAYLPPATDRSIYRPLGKKPTYDFAFFGHIPNPWNKAELQRVVIHSSVGKTVLFKDLLPNIHKHSVSQNIQMSLIDTLNKKFDINLSKLEKGPMVYDISSRSIRQYRREHCVLSALRCSDSLEIFGTENWKNYPAFKPYYKTFIEDPTKINAAMQNAKVLLHDGNYPHFRTFDAMACGTVVAAATPMSNAATQEQSWQQIGFNANEDYLNVDFYHDNSLLKSAIKNNTLLTDIARNAQEKINNHHTWAHRAEQILNDIKEL